jgi:REP element-mobilizing transposase RayT
MIYYHPSVSAPTGIGWRSLRISNIVVLDAFVVMPDHIHGIKILVETPNHAVPVVETPNHAVPVETSHVTSLPRPCSVSKIIQAYKASITKWARENGFSNFAWQSRFDDHIVRDQKSLDRIRNYILRNPEKWEEDRDY